MHVNSVNMSTFKQILNPITGRSEWEPQCENYDYHQEIARAAFADMLHDTERNQKYYKGLQIAIDRIHKQGAKANVLDIGTGTGILSMMAVRCGADSVTACEAFRPMADCAEKIIEKNGMKGLINVIKKRSTEISVGDGGDMERRANILVTEVFDTELIGEGAISIFNHAHNKLLEKNCIVVPDSATIYAQVVECPLAWSWNMPKIVANLEGEVLLTTPSDIQQCQGSAALHDIQLNQFPLKDVKFVSDPIAVQHFDWSGKTLSPLENCTSTKFIARQSGSLHVVFMWWDLKMDADNQILLSCAPFWAHPDYEQLKAVNQKLIPNQNVIPWRDHWMQALYYLPTVTPIQQSDEMYLNFNHDEYSLWFTVTKMEQKPSSLRQPLCDCGFHNAYSRTRSGQLNDNLRNKKYLKVLEDEITKDSVVLVLSDGSLLGLATSRLSAKVYCLESNRYSSKVLQSYVNANRLDNVKIVNCLGDIDNLDEITCVFGEPSFLSALVPWDNFYFGTLLSQIRSKLRSDVTIIPRRATIHAVAVEFLDLQKIRSPLGICEGFDLAIFDEFVEKSANLADSIVEPQPLWEYPCRALGKPQEILTVDFAKFMETKRTITESKFEVSGSCNGVALWVDWHLTGDSNKRTTVTSGPCTDIEVNKYIDWDIHSRQGVHLLPHAKHVDPNRTMTCETTFLPDDGDIYFKFDIK